MKTPLVLATLLCLNVALAAAIRNPPAQKAADSHPAPVSLPVRSAGIRALFMAPSTPAEMLGADVARARLAEVPASMRIMPFAP